MKFFAGLFVAALLLVSRLFAAEPLPALADPQFDPAWKALIGELGRSTTRQAEFLEKRFFPFRKSAVELHGIIRIDPARGLSLEYLGPEGQTVIFDSRGVVTRDAHGRNRPAPDDPRAQAFTNALVQVLHFDVSGLQKTFAVFGVRSDPTWQLRFVPRDADLGKYFSALDVSGTETTLREIEISSGGHPRVQIFIENNHNDVTFPAEIVARYFR